MVDIYTHKFTSKHGEKPSFESIWAKVLGELSAEDIGNGFSNLYRNAEKFSEWPPEPLEFRALCMHSEEEIVAISRASALRMAIDWGNLRWKDKNPAVLYALRQIPDLYAFNRMAEYRAKKIFDKAWDKTLEFVKQYGFEALPDIPYDGQKRLPKLKNPAVAKSELNKMREMMK